MSRALGRLKTPLPPARSRDAARTTFSRPVFDQTITIHSNHAQRLLDRGFLLVVRAEHARLAQLREANGISATPRYTNPKRITVHISSPQLAQYTALIEELDRLMTVMDALWLTGVLTNKQRADGAHQWRTRVLRTGREIIDIERRARKSAEKRGKGEELSEVEESVVAQEVSSEDSEGEDPEGATEKPPAANDER